jgi:hypothetical protein
MKAWKVGIKDELCSTIVFAETAGKAKSLALSTDLCEDAEFIEIYCHRKPEADKAYKEGKRELDWYNDEDMLFMVKELGYRCLDPFECEECIAKDFCEEWEERHCFLKI